VSNQDQMSGAPTPSFTDLDSAQSAADLTGAHNQAWNWLYIFSWCKETNPDSAGKRTWRGYNSPRYWYSDGQGGRVTQVGWRPVLEQTNNPPTLTLTSPTDNLTLAEGSTYTLSGTVSDVEEGSALSVRYSIAGGPTQSISVGTSDGETELPFSKTLTYAQGRFWDGSTDVSGLLPAETASIQVWA
ncbi:Ig-like domain-containing protein, partial [Rhizobium ruizarguesonis]